MVDFCTASFTKFHIEIMVQELLPSRVRNLDTAWTHDSAMRFSYSRFYITVELLKTAEILQKLDSFVGALAKPLLWAKYSVCWQIK